MKQHLNQSDFDQAPVSVQAFIVAWKKRKGYTEPYLTIGHCIELYMGISYRLRTEDYSDTKSYVLEGDEFVITWEGEELLDIVWYEVVQTLKKRIAMSGTTTHPE